jgi:hypothetical protein
MAKRFMGLGVICAGTVLHVACSTKTQDLVDAAPVGDAPMVAVDGGGGDGPTVLAIDARPPDAPAPDAAPFDAPLPDAPVPDAKPIPPGPRLFVANGSRSPNEIVSFALDATGTGMPITSIAGDATKLDGMVSNYPIYPGSIAFDSAGMLWTIVGNANAVQSGAVLRFGGNDQGNVAPSIDLHGDATTFTAPTGIAVDKAGKIIVADNRTKTIDVFAAGADGNVAPVRQIDVSGVDYPYDVVTDGAGDIWVAFSGSVAKFAADAQGKAAPMVTITGDQTHIGSARGIALDSSGNIWIAEDSSRAILVFAKAAHDNAAPLRRIVGDATTIVRAVGIAVDSSGRAYLATYNNVLVFAAGADGNVAPVQTLTGDGMGGWEPTDVAVH